MKNNNLTIAGLGLLVLSIFSSCEKEVALNQTTTLQAQMTTYCGPEVPFCHSTIKSFVTLNGEGKPFAIGVRFNEKLLTDLPTNPAKNVADAKLTVPNQGNAFGIDHIDFGWNPQGHEPDHVYTIPHFDLHFYMVSREAQASVIPGPDPVIVLPNFIPANYVSGVVAVPNMGVHYVDVTSPEFNGGIFKSTFIYGFYQGKMTFYELMFTHDFLLTKPQFTAPVKQPLAFQKAGYYPTSYRIEYDSSTKEYVIAAEGLKYQNASD